MSQEKNSSTGILYLIAVFILIISVIYGARVYEKRNAGPTTYNLEINNLTFRFNDAAKGKIDLKLQYFTEIEMTDFVQDTIKNYVRMIVHMTGPYMSAKEFIDSDKARLRFLNYIIDQMNNGIYRTEVTEYIYEPTGETRQALRIVKDIYGTPEYQDFPGIKKLATDFVAVNITFYEINGEVYEF